MPLRTSLVRLELCAWCAGLLCLAALLVFHVEAGRAEQAARRLGEHGAVTPAPAPTPEAPASAPPDFSVAKGVIGRLDIPALRLTVPILNDYDPESLRRGVGRIRGTAVPGGLGNFVVAGHRDTYFRPLRRVSRGMLMQVTTPSGVFDYSVDATTIVPPEDVDVLDIGDQPEMTLITCFPFDFIGAAPKRFIVRGHLLSVAGQSR